MSNSIDEESYRLIERNPSPQPPVANNRPSDSAVQRKIHGWPSQPRNLSESTLELLLKVCGNIAALVTPITFLLLAGYWASKDGQPVASDEERMAFQNVNRLLTTIFPYAFAAIVGRTVKILATWQLHCGMTLGILEQWMGSTSVFGTLMTQVSLRAFNWLGIGFVLLWIISPIGSQSWANVLSTAHEPITSSVVTAYLDTRQISKFGYESSDSVPDVFQLPVNSLYSASLMSPDLIRNSCMDLWGNIKIPDYKSLRTNFPANSSGWTSVPLTNTTIPQSGVRYSSLIGIPSTPRVGNMTFTIESTYLSLDCFLIGRSSLIPVDTSNVNGTFQSMSPDITGNLFFIALNGFVWEDGSNHHFGSIGEVLPTADVSSFPHTLLFQSPIYKSNSPQNMSVALCNISQTYVDSAVSCTMGECCVTDIRESQLTHAPSNITTLSFPYLFQIFSGFLPTATGSLQEQVYDVSTATEQYIADPASPFSSVAVDLSTVPKELFELRLGQLLNTFYLASLQPFGITGKFPNDLGANISVAGIQSFLEERYVCNWGFLAALFFSSGVLLIAALVGAVFNHLNIGPDVLGYCSSMTRDNPYVPLPPGGSGLNGMDRARLLKDLKIRLGDVASREDMEIGHIALSSFDGTMRMRRGKLYD